MKLTFAFLGLNIPVKTFTAPIDSPKYITTNIKIVCLIKEQIKVDSTVQATLSKIK